MKNIELNKRIIFALDMDTILEAKTWVNTLKDKIRFHKVGMQLFLKGGFDFVKWLKDQDVDIMLDLKLFDIPRTMNACLEQIGDYVKYVTVHSQYNILNEIDKKFREKILGVTVLTCFDDSDFELEQGFIVYRYSRPFSLKDIVIERAKKVYENLCAGIVLSGNELLIVKNNFNIIGYDLNKIVFITPGIQLEKPRKDDQKRTMTIEEAFKNDVDHVVIGRPIYNSQNPIEIVERAQIKIMENLND